MRWAKYFSYYWRRTRATLCVLAAILVVISVCASLVIVNNTPATTKFIIGPEDAKYEMVDSYLNLSFNYTAVFAIVMLVVSAVFAGSERKFLTSLGVTNWEWLASSVLYLTAYAAMLLGVNLLVAIAGRIFLMGIGVNIVGGWSFAKIMVGDDKNIAWTLLSDWASLVRTSGMIVFAVILFKRWWKPILIIILAGLAFGVALIIQVQFASYADRIVYYAEKVMRFLMEELVPFIEKYYSEESRVVVLLRTLGLGYLFYALTYPVSYRMKNA